MNAYRVNAISASLNHSILFAWISLNMFSYHRLQGGPGASGVGFGNFMEIGPHDMFGRPRNTTWLKKANVLFIDNPVGECCS